MSAVVLLIIVAMVSLLITRIATIALTVTGMPRESARFQARSALTGVGFTTGESEAVVNHPVRRRIVMMLMMLGSVGLATAVAGLLASFLRVGASAASQRIILLVGGLAAVYFASLSRWVDRRLSRLGVRLLRRFSDLKVHDVARLLHLAGEYSVKEMLAEEEDWFTGRPLGDLRLRDEGIIVLGIVRADGTYVGAPDGETIVRDGDTVIVYGRDDAFEDLATRRRGAEGDRAHRLATEEQDRVAQEEEEADYANSSANSSR
ncbi:MAG: TrkA C-terminal domain-containing protein [Actinomycetota bacterium]|nr:TrkA C-terminal domain-containing protein [Actinomycetota bacterium]